jgi:hypothetical protein
LGAVGVALGVGTDEPVIRVKVCVDWHHLHSTWCDTKSRAWVHGAMLLETTSPSNLSPCQHAADSYQSLMFCCVWTFCADCVCNEDYS